jgi:hypothetical protein
MRRGGGGAEETKLLENEWGEPVFILSLTRISLPADLLLLQHILCFNVTKKSMMQTNSRGYFSSVGRD